MIDLLISWLIPLTVLLSIALVSHRVVLTKLGPKNTYSLWVFIPLGLFFYSLPLSWETNAQILDSKIQQFIILPTQNFQHQLSLEWLIISWVFITIAILSFWCFSHLQFLKNTKVKKVNSSKLAFKLPSKLPVYQSAHTHSPMIIGVLKQKLLLPEDFTHLYNPEQQALILEHEICHFDRNDIYWNLIAFIFLALFWFHPLVWLAYFRFRRDQELSCDHIVLARKQLASRINYSRALLVAAETAPPLAFAQLSFKKYGDKEIMFERIKHIKTHCKASKFSLALASLLSVTLLSGLSYAGNISESSNKQEYRTPPTKKAVVKPIVRVEPKYPVKAVNEKIEGSVVLRFDITPNGYVTNVDVINGIPAYVFDKVATTALKQWKYDAKGQSHKNQLVQLDFRLDENSTYEDVNLIEKIKVMQ